MFVILLFLASIFPSASVATHTQETPFLAATQTSDLEIDGSKLEQREIGKNRGGVIVNKKGEKYYVKELEFKGEKNNSLVTSFLSSRLINHILPDSASKILPLKNKRTGDPLIGSLEVKGFQPRTSQEKNLIFLNLIMDILDIEDRSILNLGGYYDNGELKAVTVDFDRGLAFSSPYKRDYSVVLKDYEEYVKSCKKIASLSSDSIKTVFDEAVEEFKVALKAAGLWAYPFVVYEYDETIKKIIQRKNEVGSFHLSLNEVVALSRNEILKEFTERPLNPERSSELIEYIRANQFLDLIPEIAIAHYKKNDPLQKKFAISIFEELFRKGVGYDVAVRLADQDLEKKDIHAVTLAILLYKTMFSANHGFDEAAKIAKQFVYHEDEGLRIRSVQLCMSIVGFEKKYGDCAQIARQVLEDGNIEESPLMFDSHTLALHIFDDLVERGQISLVKREADNLIESGKIVGLLGGIQIAILLVKAGLSPSEAKRYLVAAQEQLQGMEEDLILEIEMLEQIRTLEDAIAHTHTKTKFNSDHSR